MISVFLHGIGNRINRAVIFPVFLFGILTQDFVFALIVVRVDFLNSDAGLLIAVTFLEIPGVAFLLGESGVQGKLGIE